MLARCLLMGLLGTTCLGALRGEQATATATPASVEAPPLDLAAYPVCAGHAECKPTAAGGPNDSETIPTFCAEVNDVSGGRCHPCSECHQSARATAAEPLPSRAPPPSAAYTPPLPSPAC